VEPLADELAALHHVPSGATIDTLLLRLNATVKDLPTVEDRRNNLWGHLWLAWANLLRMDPHHQPVDSVTRPNQTTPPF
jgi:hypothetical protein